MMSLRRSDCAGMFALLAVVLCACIACSEVDGPCPWCADRETIERQALARAIVHDEDLMRVQTMARELLAEGLTAGTIYNEVWIRDLATFIEPALQVNDPQAIRQSLLTFFYFQDADGGIVDGYVPADQARGSYDYIASAHRPEYLAHKNTVSTDHESSLILALARYVRLTGDESILLEEVGGRTVLQRMGDALEFLRNHRWSEAHGLIWGATTADWGDVQPTHPWGVVLDESSHRALNIYINALFISALHELIDMTERVGEDAAAYRELRETLSANAREHLWDDEAGKFIPHVYLDDSPFPESFDENEIYYHGATAVAIEAGLLSREEVGEALARMRANVEAAGAATIGLTMYPAYPDGFFENPSMRPYSYQNGGDWTWFGGRMIQQLVQYGYVREAYQELEPMVARVLANEGFYEWYTLDNEPHGAGQFRGEAGVLYTAIRMMRQWAQEELNTPLDDHAAH